MYKLLEWFVIGIAFGAAFVVGMAFAAPIAAIALVVFVIWAVCRLINFLISGR